MDNTTFDLDREVKSARESLRRELDRAVGELNAGPFLARLERLMEAKIKRMMAGSGGEVREDDKR